jgi:hypothetical protein
VTPRPGQPDVVDKSAHESADKASKVPLAVIALKSLQSKRNIPEVAPVTNERQMRSMYDVFLRMRADNEAIMALQTPVSGLVTEYLKFKLKDTNLILSLVVIVLILGFVVADVQGFYLLDRNLPFSTLSWEIETAALVAGVIVVVLFWMSLLHRYYHNNQSAYVDTPKWYASQRLRQWCLAVDYSATAVQWVNDGVIVLLTLCAGLSTLARTLRGECLHPDMTTTGESGSSASSGASGTSGSGGSGGVGGVNAASWWSSPVIACWNGEVDHDVPLEAYGLCLFVVLLPQLFCKGASRMAICLSW